MSIDLTQPMLAAFGWAIVHTSWQFLVIAAVVRLALHELTPRQSGERYLASALGLIAMVAAPALTLAWFSLPVGAGAARSLPGFAATLSEVPSTVTLSRAPTPTVVAGGGEWLQEAVGHLDAIAPWLGILWFAGATLMLAHLAVGFSQVGRLRQVGVHPVPAACREALARVATRLRVSRPVRLVESALVDVPVLIGVLRPVLLLPASVVTGLSTRELEAVLAHEVAHIRRHDYLVNLLQSVAEALLFYHPAVWWLSSTIRQERECCCDDLAVAACGGDARAYAAALSQLELLRGTAPAPALAATGGDLLHRIRRLVQPNQSCNAGTNRQLAVSGASLVVIGIGMLLALGMVPAQAVVRTSADSAALPSPPSTASAPALPSSPTVPVLAVPPSVPSVPSPPTPAVAAVPNQPPTPAVAPPAMPARPAPPSPVVAPQPPPRPRAPVAPPPPPGRASRGAPRAGGAAAGAAARGGTRFSIGDADGAGGMLEVRLQGAGDWRPGASADALPDGATLEVESGRDGQREWLRVSARRGRSPEFEFQLDGRPHPFDAAARAWMDATLDLASGRWEIAALQGERASLRGAIAGLHGERATLHGELATARGVTATLRGEIAAARGRDAAVRGEIAAVRGRRAAVRGQLAALEATRGAADRDRQVVALEAELAAVTRAEGDRVRALEAQIEALDVDGQVAAVEAELAGHDIEAQVAAVEAALAGLDVDGQAAKLEREIEVLEVERRIGEIEEGQVRDAAERLRRALERLR